MEVPSPEDEDDCVSHDYGDGAGDGESGVGGGAAGGDFPDAAYGEAGLEVLGDGLEDEDGGDDAEEHVDEHEELAEPAEDPVALEVVDEGEEGGEVGCCGEDGEQPDDEEVVGDHGVHFGEADALDSDACDDLLVREGEEEFAGYRGAGGFLEAHEDDDGAEADGDEVGDYEGEEGLRGLMSVFTDICMISW